MVASSGSRMSTIVPWNITAIRSPSASDLVELGRDDQHGRALVALLDDALVDVLDRADVEAARRLGRHDQLERPRELAGDDDLLLVAAGQVARRVEDRRRCGRRTRSTSSVAARRSASPFSCQPVENGGASSWSRTMFSATVKSAIKPVLLPVLRDVGDARPVDRSRACSSDALPSMRDLARDTSAQAGEGLDELGLAVALTPAMPTISPARTVEVDAVDRELAALVEDDEARTSSTGSPGLAGALSTARSTARPTIIVGKLLSVASRRVGVVPTTLPRAQHA